MRTAQIIWKESVDLRLLPKMLKTLMAALHLATFEIARKIRYREQLFSFSCSTNITNNPLPVLKLEERCCKLEWPPSRGSLWNQIPRFSTPLSKSLSAFLSTSSSSSSPVVRSSDGHISPLPPPLPLRRWCGLRTATSFPPPPLPPGGAVFGRPHFPPSSSSSRWWVFFIT
ncbi:hypothetical protein CONLIGDRAFT_150909 [Coniochaeta ligniaria NRRL 30616]|uniref:Uncharacterized protein n=1 Tax=Coniochaeta ligniaria NRRL 30616 TaxID=1408157 RepID=A0A1J7J5Q5_9PEZI|nr:hypothetical protein CONLIGDRAFT_150909 [Coniochaeta ligniaria NRRL 30616]